MSETRLTLISDPTAEFPNNTNADFTVRLSEPLQLKWDEMWQTVMVSLSTSNRSVGLMDLLVIRPDDVIIKATFKRVNETTNVGSDHTIQIVASEVMDSSMNITTGEDLWNRITRRVMFKQSQVQQRACRITSDNQRVFRDEMANVVMKNHQFAIKAATSNASSSESGIYAPLAVTLGLVKRDGLGHVLGPNVDCTPPLHYYSGSRLYQHTRRHVEADMRDNDELVRERHGYIYFSRYVDWTFFNLNDAFREATRVQDARSILVYSDLVQSTLVGNQKYSLLREVVVPESGGQRQSIEPMHYQWLPIRNNIVEVVHVQLADLNGALLKLPPSKTLVTVMLRRV